MRIKTRVGFINKSCCDKLIGYHKRKSSVVYQPNLFGYNIRSKNKNENREQLYA
jgi:hypothetical protein